MKMTSKYYNNKYYEKKYEKNITKKNNFIFYFSAKLKRILSATLLDVKKIDEHFKKYISRYSTTKQI